MRFPFRFKNIRFTVEDGATLVFEKFVFFGPNNQVCVCAFAIYVVVYMPAKHPFLAFAHVSRGDTCDPGGSSS